MNGFLIGISSGMVGTLLLTLIGWFLFKRPFLIERLEFIFPTFFSRRIRRISSRQQTLELFRKIFISNQGKTKTKILLMSEGGGYPEYNPFIRLHELSSAGLADVWVAMQMSPFCDWAKKNRTECYKLLENINFNLILFDNDLTPHKYRIGVNTSERIGFFCSCYGKKVDKLDLEGISTEDALFINAIEELYFGLIQKGKKVNRNNIDNFIQIEDV